MWFKFRIGLIAVLVVSSGTFAALPITPDMLQAQDVQKNVSPQQLSNLANTVSNRNNSLKQTSTFIDTENPEKYDEPKTQPVMATPLSPIEQSYANRIKVSVKKPSFYRSPILEKDALRPSRDRDVESKNPEAPTYNEQSDNPEVASGNKQAIVQFGYTLFSKPIASLGGRLVPNDASVILAPGDQITIMLWQSVEEKIDVTIDESGNGFLPKVGQIRLGGLSVGTAKSVLKQAYGAFYVNFDLDISVQKVRPITVYVVGEAARPGAYAVDRNSTFFNLLISSGGPSKQGSLRNIQLVRSGRVIAQLDLYAYLIQGKNLKDAALRDQDQIVIPAIGNTVLVMGNVLRPAIFEPLPNENLNDVLGFAGGALPFSNPNHIQISRVTGGQYQSVIDVQATQPGNRLQSAPAPLQNGDIVQIFEMPNEVKNFVEVTGNIRNPGRYAFKSGLGIKGLIDVAGGLLPDTNKNKIQITRFVSDSKKQLFHIDLRVPSENNFLLEDRDTVLFYSNQNFEGTPYVKIDGAVVDPGKYVLNQNMRISDLLLLAKIDPSQAVETAELYHQSKSGYPTVVEVDINRIMSSPYVTENVLLQRDDHLFVRASNLVQAHKLVELRGEFVYPGVYAVRDGERISSVIERAGGFTNSAFLPGAILLRESARQGELAGQRRILDDERKQLLQDQTILTQQGVDKSAAEEVLLARRKDSLAALESQINKFAGRVVTQLDPYTSFKDSIYDVPMEDKDVLTIPVYPSTIQVIGGVQNPASIIFTPGQSFDYYINQVGGYTEFASRDGIYIIKANGSTTRDLSKVQVGDVIFVPERVRLPFDWIKLITSMTDVLFKAVFLKKELFP